MLRGTDPHLAWTWWDLQAIAQWETRNYSQLLWGRQWLLLPARFLEACIAPFVVAGSSETGVHWEPREQLVLEVIASMQESRSSWALAGIPNAAFCIKSSSFVLFNLKKKTPNQYVWHTTATEIDTHKAKSSHIPSFNTCISSLEHSLASPATPQDFSNLSLIMSIYQKLREENKWVTAGWLSAGALKQQVLEGGIWFPL